MRNPTLNWNARKVFSIVIIKNYLIIILFSKITFEFLVRNMTKISEKIKWNWTHIKKYITHLLRIIRSTIFSVVMVLHESSNLNLPKRLGTAYGLTPFVSFFKVVIPWHTKSTRKCFIKSKVTEYGAPITTSETYLKN